jgi:hypothetical protein
MPLFLAEICRCDEKGMQDGEGAKELLKQKVLLHCLAMSYMFLFTPV